MAQGLTCCAEDWEVPPETDFSIMLTSPVKTTGELGHIRIDLRLDTD